MKRPLHIIIAGGGTGGHLFPGIAVARTFMQKNPENRVLFMGTDREFEKKALKQAGFSHIAQKISGIRGKTFFSKLKTLFFIPASVFLAMKTLKSFSPDIVVGVGGYASIPPVLAAKLLFVPFVIHEQNIICGVANRWLARLAHRVYLSFPDTDIPVSRKRVRAPGNPVREDILAMAGKEKKKRNTQIFHLLVMGGSQGARGINLNMAEASGFLAPKKNFFIYHLTGEKDREMVEKAYQKTGIASRVDAFTHDMAGAYADADLVICRAGATTVAEITAMGKPAVFIPYPHAADNHQVKNAKTLADRGAACIIEERELTGDILGNTILDLYHNRDKLFSMSRASRKLGNPSASSDMVEDMINEVIKGKKQNTENKLRKNHCI